MKKKIFQSGGPIIDEDELFEDGCELKGNKQPTGGSLEEVTYAEPEPTRTRRRRARRTSWVCSTCRRI
jgi:hypothetical protein